MRVSMKHALKAAMQRVAPEFTTMLVAIRSRRLQESRAQATALTSLASRVAKMTDFQCWSGPFKGMRFPDDIVTRHSSPKLLGTYESELHPNLALLLSRPYNIVVNVGMAEGYYVVGCALRLPQATVYGFDADPAARRRTREMAAINGVSDRVIVGGLACHRNLQDILCRGPSLLIIDCEGCEAVLLDPAQCDALSTTDIIAELHPHAVPNIEAMIEERFRLSHDLRVVRSERREAYPLEFLRDFSLADRLAATNEYRGQSRQPWAIMVAKTTGKENSAALEAEFDAAHCF